MKRLMDLLVALSRHDWFYNYSDDYGAYTRGRDAENQISYMVGSNPEFIELLRVYSASIHNPSPEAIELREDTILALQQKYQEEQV